MLGIKKKEAPKIGPKNPLPVAPVQEEVEIEDIQDAVDTEEVEEAIEESPVKEKEVEQGESEEDEEFTEEKLMSILENFDVRLRRIEHHLRIDFF